MDSSSTVVIVGAGLAGAKTAEALRGFGFQGEIVLIGAESHRPYERPPLSKAYLSGSAPFGDAYVHPESWYGEHRIDLRLGIEVSRIQPAKQQVTLSNGTVLTYDRLVLATGTTPRDLPLSGPGAPNIHYLRTVEDADAIKAIFGPGRRVVIIGGGWIGLEVAAAARGADTEVTVVESAELPLVGVLGSEIAQVFADLHREHGASLRLAASVTGIEFDGGLASGVEVDGQLIPVDAIVVGVGVRPNVELAEAAGLAADNGILVDAGLRTSDPNIYAVGDIANVDHPILGRRIRVEHWATALNQPATAAAAILGRQARYEDLPYFFTDQYDLGMEYIGHAPKDSYAQVVVRGDLARREFVAFWLDEDTRVLAAMAVNVWDVIDQIRPLILARKSVDPRRLADPEVSYAAL